jgi:hypothetical protein
MLERPSPALGLIRLAMIDLFACIEVVLPSRAKSRIVYKNVVLNKRNEHAWLLKSGWHVCVAVAAARTATRYGFGMRPATEV